MKIIRPIDTMAIQGSTYFIALGLKLVSTELNHIGYIVWCFFFNICKKKLVPKGNLNVKNLPHSKLAGDLLTNRLISPPGFLGLGNLMNFNPEHEENLFIPRGFRKGSFLRTGKSQVRNVRMIQLHWRLTLPWVLILVDKIHRDTCHHQ